MDTKERKTAATKAKKPGSTTVRKPASSAATKTRKATPTRKRRAPVQNRPTPDVVYTQPGPFNRNRFLLHILSIVAVVLALLFGMSVFFKVEVVTVAGTSKYTAWDVRQASGVAGCERFSEKILSFLCMGITDCVCGNDFELYNFVSCIHIFGEILWGRDRAIFSGRMYYFI